MKTIKNCIYEKLQILTNVLPIKTFVIQMRFATILLEITRVVAETVFSATVSLVPVKKIKKFKA